MTQLHFTQMAFLDLTQERLIDLETRYDGDVAYWFCPQCNMGVAKKSSNKQIARELTIETARQHAIHCYPQINMCVL